MPITVLHELTATTPDNTSYEIRPSHWNEQHVASLNVVGSEIIGAFSNANSVSFGTAPNGQITVSVGTNQSNQTIGVSALGNTTINNNSTFDARSFGFSGAGNVSIGIIGSNIVISDLGGGGAGGNLTLAAGTNTLANGVAAFGNANNVTFGMDVFGNVTATASFQSGINFSASNAAANLSSIVFGNANGASFGLVGSTLTVSYTQPSIAGLISNIVVSGSNGASTATAISFANSNGVSFGLTNGSLFGSVNQSNQTIGVYANGNTILGSSGTLDARSMLVQGFGNASVGFSNGSLIVSAAGGGGGGGGIAASAGTTQVTAGTLQFVNSNGFTWGLTNGSQLTATFTPGPSAGMAAIGAGTQTQTTGTMVFQNSNGITFGMSNSSVITASYTVPVQTTQPVGVSGSNGSFAYSTLSLGALNGATFYTTNGSVAMSYTVPSTAGLISAIGVSAGTQASNLSAVTFNNSNNVSFGLSAGTITGSAIINVSAGSQASGFSAITFGNANGVTFGLNNGTITGSINAGTQTVQSLGVYAQGNTTGGSSSTYDARSLSFSGVGNITVGNSGGMVLIGDNGGKISAFGASNTVLASSGTLQVSAMTVAGAGNVSVGVSNGSLVVSGIGNTAGSVFAVSNTTQQTSATFALNALSFAGAGLVSVGVSGNTVLISGPGTTNAAFVAALSAGTTIASTGTVVFSNSNGVTFGMNNGTITATVQPGAAAGIGAVSAGTQQQTIGTLNFVNSNGVTFGMSGSNSITASVLAAGGVLSIYGVSNTTGTTSSTFNAGSLSFAGAGVISVGMSNGSIMISGPNTTTLTLPGISSISGTGAVSVSVTGSTIIVGVPVNSIGVSGGNTAGFSGTVSNAFVLAGGSNITLSGTTNASGMTVSINGGGGGAAQTGISSIVVSNTTYTNGLVSLVNANGISFGSSGASGISASYTVPTQSVQTQGVQGVSLSGNTAGALANITSGTAFFAGGNNITLSQNGQSITISGANAAGAQTGISSIVVSNTTYTAGLVSFVNANGASFGSSGASGISMSYTVPAQSNQTEGMYALGNTTGQSSSSTFDARTLSISGAGNVSVGYSGNALIISGAGGGGGGIAADIGGNSTSAGAGYSTLTNGTMFLAGGNNITLSQNGQSITISGANAGGAQTGISGIVVSNTTYTSGTVTFQNANGISFGSSGANGVSASYTVPSTVGLISAFKVSGGASSVNATAITFSNSNNVTFGLSTGASVGTMTGSFALNVSAGGGTSNALSAITFSNSNNITFGLSTGAGVGTMTASYSQSNQTVGLYAAGNTTQNSSTTLDARTLSFNALGAMTVGYSNGSVQLSAPATSSIAGAAGISISVNGSTISVMQGAVTRSMWPNQALTAVGSPGQGSMSIQYFPADGALTASRLDALFAWQGASAATNATMGIAVSAYGVVYTRNAGTLSSLSSGSTQTTYTYASNTAGNTQLLTNAIRPLSVPVNMNFSQGEYFVGFNFSTNTSSIGATTTNYAQTLSVYGGSNIQSAVNYAEFTNQTALSNNLYQGMGVYSVQTAGAPVTVALSDIVATGASLSQANIALVFRNA